MSAFCQFPCQLLASELSLRCPGLKLSESLKVRPRWREWGIVPSRVLPCPVPLGTPRLSVGKLSE